MKKLTCLLLCLGTGLAHATPNHSFTGLYLKGGIGATSAQFDVDPYYSAMTFPFSFLGDYNMAGTSPSGLLGLGYLYQFANHFVLGAEATAGYTKAQTSYHPLFDEFLFFGQTPSEIKLSNVVEAKLTNDFALLFKPGYASGKNTLFYGIVGPRWGNFETSTSGELFLSFPPGDPIMASGSDTESGYQLGLTVGGGIQQRIAEKLYLSLEYAYTNYGDIDSPSVRSEIFEGSNPSGQYAHDEPELASSTNTLMLELSYQW